MWAGYRDVIQRYRAIPLAEERELIARAQEGSAPCRDELVLRHIGFVIFRLRRKIGRSLLGRFGEDLLSDGLLILQGKIQTYNLDYRDPQGRKRPVRFASYIWKRIDGFIVDALHERLQEPRGYGHSPEEDEGEDGGRIRRRSVSCVGRNPCSESPQ